MTRSDILIIGAGPGGYETALKAVSRGLKVTLVERDLPGGTCLNRGCIPTKALCRSAEVMLTARNAAEFGVKVADVTPDFSSVMDRKDAIVKQLREGVESLLETVNLVRGEARFVSSSEVEVAGEVYTAPRIIVATGSSPARLDIPGAEMAMTSDDVLSMRQLPKSIIIIGGGVIGMEFASVLNAFGVDITVVEYCKEILPPFDAEVAKRLRMAMRKRGVNIITGASVTSIAPDGKSVGYLAKGKETSLAAEAVLMAVGRRAVIPSGLVEAGALTERGYLKTDDGMRLQWSVDTLLPEGVEVYAIGDVNGRCMLAHAATAQGDIVLGESRNLNVIPSAVFTSPECAMVGLTEAQCAERGLDFKVGKSTFRANGKAMAMGETEGLVKMIADSSSGELFGCHICGPHAADLIVEPTAIMTSGLPAEAMSRSIHAHPTLSEALIAAL